jgi:hypothetical protein
MAARRNHGPCAAWAALVLVVVAAASCETRHPLAADGGADGPGAVFVQELSPRTRDVDLLFMVDNSLSMGPLQQKLVANFDVFVQQLRSLPGGAPDLHIGVVSSDMGAGPFTEIPQCHPGGDQGVLQNAPRGSCTATGLDAGARFISFSNAARNFSAGMSLEQVFACIAPLGASGCGFEHQLASVARALGADGAPAPAANAGFLRPDAKLVIVLVTNEDDCSAPPDSRLFDPASRFVSDPLGPLASYRCNEFGHTCNGTHPPRTQAGDLGHECHSAEDGVLVRVSDFVAELRALKDHPSNVTVSSIAGPAEPYAVTLIPAALKADPSMWPQVVPSCTTEDASADPAVRLRDFTEAIGGGFFPICAATFAPVLQRVAADSIGQTRHCLTSAPSDHDATLAGIQPACTVTDAGRPLSVCEGSTPPNLPCYAVAPNQRCPASGMEVFLQAGGAVPELTGPVVLRCD